MNYFVGLDWGSTEHAVCVVDAQGEVVLRGSFEHSSEGLDRLAKALAKIGAPQELACAIERPSGLIVDKLVELGHPVFPIHPNALKACRPRYRAALSKSDRGDAFILADVLRTDGHRIRPLRPLSDEVRALRALVRVRDDLVAERVAVANQLRSLLESFWPGAATIFSKIDSLISLAFLAKYPTPKSALKLGPKRLEAFLNRHGYSGKRAPKDLLERLRGAPEGLTKALEEEVKGELVQSLTKVLKVLVEQIRSVTSRIERAVAELPLGQIMMSFPRAGKLNAAQIVAELGEDLARFQSADHLAAEAGVAPVTHQSGKSRGVCFRYACNKRLRKGLTLWAGNTRHSSEWAKAKYAAARARGCDHPHAVRILARAWVKVLWGCWRDGNLYDESSHGGAQRFKNAA